MGPASGKDVIVIARDRVVTFVGGREGGVKRGSWHIVDWRSLCGYGNSPTISLEEETAGKSVCVSDSELIEYREFRYRSNNSFPLREKTDCLNKATGGNQHNLYKLEESLQHINISSQAGSQPA